MTNKQLYDEIFALLSGHEEASTEVNRFYDKVNAALEQVNSLRPMEMCRKIIHRPVVPIKVCDVHHDSGVDDEITAYGVVGFSFRVFGSEKPSVEIIAESGETLASITDGESWTTGSVAHATVTTGIDGYVEHRLRFSSPRDVTVRFTGDHYYNADGVGLYPYSVDHQQIYAPYLEYNLREQIGERFLAFASTPVREGERALYVGQDFLLSDDSVSFPFDAKGTYDVYVQLKPGRYTGTEDDGTVQIAADLVGLVPYLTAYIILLPDDPEYAMQLKRRYDEMVQTLTRHTTRAQGYANVTGWGV